MIPSVELLKQLVAIPSVSRDETAVADFLQQYLQENGLHPQRIGNNLYMWADTPDSGKPNLMLNAHLDTVKPNASWATDPFVPVERDGAIYGLGANDDLASVVSLLAAFGQLRTKSQSYNLLLAFSCEEEVSGKNGMELLLQHLPPIGFAVVGEPTGMRLAVAEKGLMVIDAVTHGKAGHAARDEGENAIYKAIGDIQWLSGYRFPKVSETLGPVKLSVTMISAGTQHNVVPDECRYVIDVRLNEHYSHQEVLDELKRHVQAELTPRSMRLRPSGIGLDHPFVARCMAQGIGTFGSSTLSDQALMPFPSVKIGPGDSARSHTAGEFVRICEIEQAVMVYVSLLDGLTLG
ncbi:MAG: M20 family metallo-hydrolase [Paludibacteraceae bacterium]|nr:M20 family metallo-hydrolase [Paludibacteraceae bacterium]